MVTKHAVCIDSWKLDIFSRVLKYYGFSFVKNPGITDDTLTLSIETDDIDKLAEVVRFANTRAAVKRRNMRREVGVEYVH